MRHNLFARAGIPRNDNAFSRRIKAVAEGFRPLAVGHAKRRNLDALVLVDRARLHVVGPHHQGVALLQARGANFDVPTPRLQHVLEAWRRDIEIRTTGLEQRDALVVRAHDVKAGAVYQDERVKVTAFRVPHGQWPEAFGYRFDTPGKSIVISGDTSPSEEIVAHCQPCDVLLSHGRQRTARPHPRRSIAPRDPEDLSRKSGHRARPGSVLRNGSSRWLAFFASQQAGVPRHKADSVGPPGRG